MGGICGVLWGTELWLWAAVGYLLLVFTLGVVGLALFFGTGLINFPFGSLDVFVCRLTIEPHSRRNFGETELVFKSQGKGELLFFG